MNNQLGRVLFLIVFGFSRLAQACINDSKTLWEEKHQHPTLAQAILSPKTEKPDVKSLTEDLQKLKANPKTNDVAWWNDLAGAYLRLGQPAEAVKILEPLTNRFAADYGVHANLGTAYHLLGRYMDAEKEIRRDLEINPDAHFGFEKYHLALLQYLSRDEAYQARHVYVDEFTRPFLTISPQFFWVEKQRDIVDRRANSLTESERKENDADTFKLLRSATNSASQRGQELWFVAQQDQSPAYSEMWDLGVDSKLEDGVIYMATLNSREPSCWVMLGVLGLKHRDLHLASKAFERAIELHSPQAPILKAYMNYLENHPPVGWGFRHPVIFGIEPIGYYLILVLISIPIIAVYLFRKVRRSLQKKPNT